MSILTESKSDLKRKYSTRLQLKQGKQAFHFHIEGLQFGGFCGYRRVLELEDQDHEFIYKKLSNAVHNMRRCCTKLPLIA